MVPPFRPPKAAALGAVAAALLALAGSGSGQPTATTTSPDQEDDDYYTVASENCEKAQPCQPPPIDRPDHPLVALPGRCALSLTSPRFHLRNTARVDNVVGARP